MSRILNADEATVHLRANDPVMDRIIAAIGPFGMREDSADSFRSLSRSIVYQQLSGKAAGTIFGRFIALFEPDQEFDAGVTRTDPAWVPLEREFPKPEALLARTDDELRGVGLSRQKIASLRSLAEHFASGELGNERFDHWEDEEIVAHLTRVRGIGRWTAEMFLMFHLRRPDVLPVNDVGINRAIKNQYGLEALPGPGDVQAIGAAWRPFATVACWYLWRTEDTKLPAE
ncbi:MAG: DNA-3-methyladenine glycosylase 2 family protein [Dehalococcoidia bacterium]|nr:DNA-3-methyladenine glycosylase 2 family protein [Dehalococcoidia bacterium]